MQIYLNKKEWKLIEEVLNVIGTKSVRDALLEERVNSKVLSTGTFSLWRKMMIKSGRITNATK